MFLFFFLFFSYLSAMIPGSPYNNEDLINYAKQFCETSSCCAIFSPSAELSGVLIADDIVITAAHGAVKMGTSTSKQNAVGLVALKAEDVYVVFDNTDYYKVDTIYIDQRYLTEEKEEYGKYDIAFLKLSKKVINRQPIRLEKELCINKSDASFVVISHGMSDQQSFLDLIFKRKYQARAFALTEWSPFYVDARSFGNIDFIRSLLYSSIFFDSRKTYTEHVAIDAENNYQRTMEALRNWYNEDKPPFALGLPGTSGSPIFLKNGKSLTLVGLVVAYSPTDRRYVMSAQGYKYLLTFPESAVGKFQTIFCLLYKEKVLQNTHNTLSFELDPIVQKILTI